jgi:hypothetical protein
MRWENAGVTNLNHMMDTVTKTFSTFEKIKTLIGFPSHIELKNSLFRSLNSDCFKFDSEVNK